MNSRNCCYYCLRTVVPSGARTPRRQNGLKYDSEGLSKQDILSRERTEVVSRVVQFDLRECYIFLLISVDFSVQFPRITRAESARPAEPAGSRRRAWHSPHQPRGTRALFPYTDINFISYENKLFILQFDFEPPHPAVGTQIVHFYKKEDTNWLRETQFASRARAREVLHNLEQVADGDIKPGLPTVLRYISFNAIFIAALGALVAN